MDKQHTRLLALGCATLSLMGPALAEDNASKDRTEFNIAAGIELPATAPEAARASASGRANAQARGDPGARPRRTIRVVLPSPYGQ